MNQVTHEPTRRRSRRRRADHRTGVERRSGVDRRQSMVRAWYDTSPDAPHAARVREIQELVRWGAIEI